MIERLLAAVRDPAGLAPGTRVHQTPAGWCSSHPLPLAQLNTARPESLELEFLDLVSREHAGVWSRVSVRRLLEGLAPALESRGYRPLAPVDLMTLKLEVGPRPGAGEAARLARTPDELRAWYAASLRLRGEPQAVGEDLPWALLVGSSHHLFVLEQGGEVRGIAALQVLKAHGIGLLWGACTAPRWRRRGVHQALLAARLELAWRAGVRQVLALAAPSGGGPSLARAGFEPTGHRIHSWERPPRISGSSARSLRGEQG